MTNILSQNLNDEVSYQQFFAAFGYDPDDTVWLRRFYDQDKTQQGCNMPMTPEKLEKNKQDILALHRAG